MRGSLNLIPKACLDARSRSQRQLAWSLAVLTFGALVFAGWVGVKRAREQFGQFDDQFAVLQSQQTDLDLKLTRASRERAELFNRARAVMWLRPINRLPEQLVALSKIVPDGVTISDIKAAAFVVPKPPALSTPPPAVPAVNTTAAVPPPPPRRGARQIQIAGWANSFAEVQQFVEAAAGVPNWQKIELVKSSREIRGDKDLIQFRIECQDREGGP